MQIPTVMLHQEMLHTKISVIRGNVMEEELPENRREGTEGEGDPEVGRVIGSANAIGAIVIEEIKTEVSGMCVDEIVTETERGTGKEIDQGVGLPEETADHPAAVTDTSTKRVNGKSVRGVKNQIEMSRKRSKTSQKIMLNDESILINSFSH